MIKIFTDGGLKVREIEDISYISYKIIKDGEVLDALSEVPSWGDTNNENEYIAAIIGLSALGTLKEVDDEVILISDSQLMVRQLSGKYKTKSKQLKIYRYYLAQLIDRLNVKVKWTTRGVIERQLGH